MDFYIGLLNFIGFILYIVAAIAVFILFGLVSNDGKRGVIIKVAVVVFVSGCGGYLIRNYSDTLKRNNYFSESLINNDKEKVKWHFIGLSNEYKKEHVGEIYNKFYSTDPKGIFEFVNDYGNETLPFVHDKIIKANEIMSNMYDVAEALNTSEGWLTFSSQVNGKLFMEYASDELKRREFSKWNTDERAWERVLVMDSLVMSHEYLARYRHGLHEDHARKIILDHHYDDFSNNQIEHRPPFKITSNYCGTTTLSIQNSSNVDIEIHYSGTFAEGRMQIPSNGYNSINLPNGYYHINAEPRQSRSRGESSLETLYGGVKHLDYHIIQDTGRRR